MAKRDTWSSEGLYFIPLGGSEQFGVNLNVYACNGKLLAVDCGLGFADERHPGVDLLLPDPALLEDNQDKLEGLIITHAHEDHIGAVAYLWERLQCPIYCTPFTAAVLQEKLNDAGVKRARPVIIKPKLSFSTGTFNITPLPVSHSVPDTCALLIETAHGRVLHSGDWNLDPEPVAGYKTDESVFREAGKKGILAYVGDSTNAQVPGRAGSESLVEQGLAEEFKNCPGKIAVTVFSSNIGRVISIARAARDCGRTVCVVGRSLHRMISAAHYCGYMKDVPDFVNEEDMGYMPDDKVVLIVTGSQGEPRSALAKIARGEHQSVKLRPRDTVIFSARAIPGNEKNINVVKNNLSGGDIKIITPDDTSSTIHVSGHPCRDEISDMFQWLRPNTVIPVHGEHTQLQAHAELARTCQVPNVIVPKNGSVIRLAPGTPFTVDHVETGLLAVEPKRIISSDHRAIAARRKLQFSGTVHVTVILNGRGELVAPPQAHTIGLVDEEEGDGKQFADNLHDEILELIEEMSWEERTDDVFVKEELRIGMRRFVYHFLGIKPLVTIHLVRL